MHGHGPFRSLLPSIPAFSTDAGDAGGSDSGGDSGAAGSDAGDGTGDGTSGAAADADDATDWKAKAAEYKAEADKWKPLARKHENRSTAAVQAFAAAARKLGLDPKDLAASDQDAAIATAREESRAEALREVAHERVESAFTAATAGRMTDTQRDALIEGINPAAFLTDDGKVDRAKIVKHVEALAPAAKNGGPDLGQGRRDHAGKATGVSVGREMYAESRKRSTTPAA